MHSLPFTPVLCLMKCVTDRTISATVGCITRVLRTKSDDRTRHQLAPLSPVASFLFVCTSTLSAPTELVTRVKDKLQMSRRIKQAETPSNQFHVALFTRITDWIRVRDSNCSFPKVRMWLFVREMTFQTTVDGWANGVFWLYLFRKQWKSSIQIGPFRSTDPVHFSFLTLLSFSRRLETFESH